VFWVTFFPRSGPDLPCLRHPLETARCTGYYTPISRQTHLGAPGEDEPPSRHICPGAQSSRLLWPLKRSFLARPAPRIPIVDLASKTAWPDTTFFFSAS